MLTGDPIEAIEEARTFLKNGTVLAYYDEILLGALRLAEADAARGRLDDERLEKIHETVSEVIEDIGSHSAAKKTKEIDSAPAPDKVVKIDARKFGKSVFCVPGLGRLDDCAALVVADILKREGFNARISGSTQKSITRTRSVSVLLKRYPQGERRSRHGSSRAGQPRRTSSSVDWATPKERSLPQRPTRRRRNPWRRSLRKLAKV
jgi:hypothetical protein